MKLTFLSLGLVGTLALSLTACGGGAAPEAKAPFPSREESEPTSIEEAQDQISRARDQLASVSSKEPGRPGSDATGAPAAEAPPKAADSAGPAKTTPKPSAGKAGRPSVDENQCSSPCRALASMRRAVTALCRMTGETDNRCRDAKRTLADSESRITPCSC
jgi:hypothetical protein